MSNLGASSLNQLTGTLESPADAEPRVRMHDAQRETGLPKDTLRAWERRYTFPTPTRDATGERLYTPSDIAKLRVLKKLVDHGVRPSTIVQLPIETLRRRLSELGAQSAAADFTGAAEPFLRVLRRHDETALRTALNAAMHRQGLELFVVATVAPLARAVGASWNAGALEIFEEHLFSETIQSILRNAITALGTCELGPTVLLTTPPGEQHQLGLLMVHALLGLEGARCISLGPETPAADIVLAARAHAIDVVALSIAGSYSPLEAQRVVAELVTRLDQRIELWIGGAGARAFKEPIERVRVVGSLNEIRLVVQAWRTEHGTASSD